MTDLDLSWFRKVPDRRQILSGMIRVDGILCTIITGGAPIERQPVRDENAELLDRAEPISVRGLIAKQVVFSTALDPFMSLRALAKYSNLSRSTLEAFITLPPSEALKCYRVIVPGKKLGRKVDRSAGKILVRLSDFIAFMERFVARGKPSVERAMRDAGLLPAN